VERKEARLQISPPRWTAIPVRSTPAAVNACRSRYCDGATARAGTRRYMD